jgi:hypothetical protein
MGERRNAYEILIRKLKARDMGDKEIGTKIILK